MVLTNDLYMSLENLELWDYSTWPFWFAVAFAAVIALGVEILSFFVLHAFAFAPPIAIKGKHLDVLETLDVAFIYFNRLSMVPFMYHVIQVVYYTPTILLRHEEATLMNTAGSLIAFFVFYDFFYHVSLLKQYVLYSSVVCNCSITSLLCFEYSIVAIPQVTPCACIVSLGAQAPPSTESSI